MFPRLHLSIVTEQRTFSTMWVMQLSILTKPSKNFSLSLPHPNRKNDLEKLGGALTNDYRTASPTKEALQSHFQQLNGAIGWDGNADKQRKDMDLEAWMAIRKELIDQGLHFPSWERDHTDVKSIGAANKARRRNNARRKAKSEAGQGQKRGKEEQDDSDESPSQSKGKEKKHEREGQDESDGQPPRGKARIVPHESREPQRPHHLPRELSG